MSEKSGSNLTITSMILSLLAIVGVTNLPLLRAGGGPPPAMKGASTAPPNSDVQDAPDRAESLIPSGELNTPEAQLRTLEPLVRFYRPKLMSRGALDQESLVETILGGMGDDLQFLIATVAHPGRSDMPFRFDSSMLAIQTAMRRGGYVLDTYRIPWRSQPKSREHPARTALAFKLGKDCVLAVESTTDSGDDADPHQPGVVIFRRSAHEADSQHKETSQALRVVLLVTNTPIAGVDPVMLIQALKIAARSSVARGKAGKPYDPIRIIGPDFSGTPSSIARAMDAWSNRMGDTLKEFAAPPVRFITGSAQELLRKPLAHDKNLYDLRMTCHTGEDYRQALLTFIGPNRTVAILSEESSGFGEAVSRGNASLCGSTRTYNFSFPLNISELRRRYEESGMSGDESNLKTAERLRVSIAERSASSERIPQESPGISVPADELRLIQMAREMRRLGIHDAIIQASDVRDILFLTRFLRSQCPGMRLYCVAADLSMTQQNEMSHLRGLVVASTYPLNFQAVGERKTSVSLPNQAAFGVYNATLAHLIEQEQIPEYKQELVQSVIEYRNPATKGDMPPIWLVASSQHGFFPVELVGSQQNPSIWSSPEIPNPWSIESLDLRIGQAAGWMWCFGVVSVGLLGFSAAYLQSFLFPKDGRSQSNTSRDRIGEAGQISRDERAMREVSRSISRLSRAGSWVDDHLGFAGIRRYDEDTPVDDRRRLGHMYFLIAAWVSYVLFASPAPFVIGSRQIGAWYQSVIGLLLVSTLFVMTSALCASMYAWLWGRIGSRLRGRLPLRIGAMGLCALLMILGIWLIGWGTHEGFEIQGRLYAIRAVALASGVSPLLTVLVALGGVAFFAANRLRDVRVVRPFRGKWHGGPVPHGLGLGLTFFADATARLHRDAQDFRFRWRHSAFWPQWFLWATVGVVSAWIVHCCRRHYLAGLEPKPIEWALGLGAVLLVAGLAICLVQLGALGRAIQEAAECAACLPIGRVLGRLPRLVTKQFGNFFDAVQGDLPSEGAEGRNVRRGAGGVVLEPIYQQQANALLNAIYQIDPEALSPTSGTLMSAIVADQPDEFDLYIRDGFTQRRDLGTIRLGDKHNGSRSAVQFTPALRAAHADDAPAPTPIKLHLTADQKNVLRDSFESDGPVEGRPKDLLVAALRAEFGWLKDLDAGQPTLDTQHLHHLQEALEKPYLERSGSLIARECCRLLRPFWETSPANLACDPLSTAETERSHSAKGLGDFELGAYPETAGQRGAARRLLEAAEIFVAMEIARELNRYLSALWLRVTAVTVMAVLVLIYVNSYPFGPAAQLLTLAFGALVLATVAAVRSIWMFHTDPFLTTVTGRADSSIFSRELIGRLLTFVGPLLVGLGAVLSFAASDILRAMIGPWV